MGKRFAVFLIAAFVVVLAVSVQAQVTTGTISGVVKDSSEAAVPGTKVVLLNQDTGISRTAQTDDSGHYSATSLSLGNYSITASHDGFQTVVRTGILLTVGREAVVDLALSVGSVTQTVEVTGEAPTIETTNATVSGLVSGDQIRDLPLNGRSIADLALLSPGVQLNRSGLPSSANGFGQRLSVNGGRAESNLYLIDGTVANNTSGSTSTVSGQSLGVEGVREFRVLTHDFSAEYGRNSGSVVSVVTRSGTNQFHGSVYEFVRNNYFDARSWNNFDSKFNPTPLPPFRRNQFGAAAGGPIRKDKIFFFANYEGLRQRLSSTIGTSIPDANARMGMIPVSGVPTPVTYVPNPGTVNPYLFLYPDPQGRVNLVTGTVPYNLNYSTPTDENYGMGRMDYHISDKDTFYARYIYDYSNDQQPRPMPTLSDTADIGYNNYAILSETHIFSPTALNDFRFAFNRTVLAAQTVFLQTVNPSLSFDAGLPLGNIKFGQGVGQLTEVGNADNQPFSFIQNLFQATDTITLVRGAHSLKFGVDFERTQFNGERGSNYKGTFTFGSLQGFLAGTPTQLSDAVVGPYAGLTSTRARGFRRILFGTFIQDDYRISSRLTVNLGLRYEFYGSPSEVSGKSASLINLTDTASTPGTPFHTAKTNFAPRVGLAWDPTGSGKTSIRAGAGVFYDQVDGQVWQRLVAQESRFYFTYTIKNPTTFPHAPTNPPLSSQAESTVEYNLPTPTSVHYNLDVQRQLTPTLSLSLGYVGSYNYNMTRIAMTDTLPPLISTGATLANGIVYPVGATYFDTTNSGINPITNTPNNKVINQNFASIEQMRADTIGNYNAFQASLQKSSSAGLTFGATYTFSKSLSQADNAQNRVVDNGVYSSSVANNPGRDYGLSSYDQRHIIVLNSSYKMPWDHLLNSRLSKATLGGWEVNGIYSYSSGMPMTANLTFNNSLNGDTNSPDRPNLLPGFSSNPTSGVSAGCKNPDGSVAVAPGTPLHTATLWFDPCAFGLSTPIPTVGKQLTGTYGNLGRNTIIGPTFNVMNFTLVKNTALTESKRLEFRAEFFNIFNHSNFGVPVIKVLANTGAHNSNEGNMALGQDPMSYPNRQIQLGMKLVF